MRELIIACETIEGEMRKAMEEENSPREILFLPGYYHSDPKQLNERLKAEIKRHRDYDRIYFAMGNCGGGTEGLETNGPDLILPKVGDCIDILLSGSDTKRSMSHVYVTESWAEYMKNSTLGLEYLEKNKGKDKAKEYLRKVYKGYETFYVIDTGVYDLKRIDELLGPMLEIIGGKTEVVMGNFEILRKMARGEVDEDFFVIRKED